MECRAQLSCVYWTGRGRVLTPPPDGLLWIHGCERGHAPPGAMPTPGQDITEPLCADDETSGRETALPVVGKTYRH